jgi:hypothetical protein
VRYLWVLFYIHFNNKSYTIKVFKKEEKLDPSNFSFYICSLEFNGKNNTNKIIKFSVDNYQEDNKLINNTVKVGGFHYFKYNLKCYIFKNFLN